MLVIVTSVLLNVALIHAMPSDSTCFFVRFVRAFFGCAMVRFPSRFAREAPAGAPVSFRPARARSPLPPREPLRPPRRRSAYFRGAFFLPAIARRWPLCVRAFVCVRWPRTGSPRRCRSPR